MTSDVVSLHVPLTPQTRGLFNAATFAKMKRGALIVNTARGPLVDEDALLALKVNGVDLSPDHGYPARIIVPAMPGVLNTKWVRSIRFEGSR